MGIVASLPTSIPSPDQGVWYIGSFPLRAYALIIVVGILVAVWVGERRWLARGGQPGTVADVALWAVPFGIVGGRLYHVISDNQIYFGPGGGGFDAAVRIWDGGLGIWGAVLGGGLGAWIAMRRKGLPLPPMADAIAPAIVLAQAIGRLGNYFNQELFGAPSDLPWALEIDPLHRPQDYMQFVTFHPTFAYEALWSLAVFGVLLWADRRFGMGHGRVFALYVLLYCVGRLWIEMLRIDAANHILGLRLNVWTSVIVGTGAALYLVISARRRPGREPPEVLWPDRDADLVGESVPAWDGEATGRGAADSQDRSATASGDRTATETATEAATEDAPEDAVPSPGHQPRSDDRGRQK